MAGISLGGLSSGLDTQALIDQLMALDRAPETRLKLNKSAAETRQSALNDIGTRLRSLMQAGKDLGSATTWVSQQSLDVSDSTKLSATRLSGAAPGGHEVTVTQLARAEQRSYAFTAGQSGTLTLGAASVDVATTDTGQDVADKINSATDSPVYAVFVKDALGTTGSDRMYFTRRETGTFDPGAMTVAGVGWSASESEPRVDGANAQYSVDGGLPRESRTNVTTSAVPGLQLAFKAKGTTMVTVGTPAADDTAVKTKVQAFVDQYNSTIDFIRGKLSEKRVPNATTDTDARKGVLFGDSQLTGLLGSLRAMVADKTGITGAVQSLGDLGVTTGAATGGTTNTDSVAGKLTFDADKLVAALQSDRGAVRSFFSDAAQGLSAKLTSLLDPIAKSSSGTIATRAASAGTEMTRIDDRITQIEDRLTERSTRLKAQFTAMERALAQSQSQSSWLTQQLG